MQKFEVHQGLVAPLPRANVDTDAIIPKQFLKSIRRTGSAELVRRLRYLDRGDRARTMRHVHSIRISYSPGPLPGRFILLAGKNFGCGSSREHAPWALIQFGFRAVVAPSFADIFFNNCTKNGLLPVALPEAVVDRLFDEVAAHVGYRLTVDLPRQRVIEPDGTEHGFDVAPFRKHCLINGFDDIELTLRHKDKIAAFETKRLADQPWLAKTSS